MLCGIADCHDSGIEDCAGVGTPHLRTSSSKDSGAQGNVQRMGRAQAKVVGATGANGLRAKPT